MLKRPVARVLAGIGLGLPLVVAPLTLAPPAHATDGPGAPPSSGAPSPPVVDAAAGGGGVSVTVSGSGTTVEGVPFAMVRTRGLPRVCWYWRGMSGKDYYDYWGPDGGARVSGTLDAYAYQDLFTPAMRRMRRTRRGPGSGRSVSSDAPVDYVAEYRVADHPPVYWWPSDPVPASREDVDPRVLARDRV